MEINPETLEIEIVDVEPIEGGVQVFARAWSDGQQIGFGVDGTVDIERFRIFNPPILVRDDNGDYIVEGVYDTVSGETTPDRVYREDPTESLLVSLANTISVMKHVASGENIIANKVGNTTSTIYAGGADADIRYYKGTTYADSRIGTTGSFLVGANIMHGEYTGVTDDWIISRFFYPFDTSVIGSGQTVSSAIFSAYKDASASTNVETTYPANISLVEGTFADPASITNADWNNLGTTKLGTDILITNSSAGYKDWTLNNNSVVNVTGWTKLALRPSNDFSNATEPTARSFSRNWQFSEAAGTSQDPKLVVEHAAGGGGSPTPLRMMMGMGS